MLEEQQYVYNKEQLGEGSLGVALWYWQETQYNQIYVTVFDKHFELISLFERFGFKMVGTNARGECVYIKNREKYVTEQNNKTSKQKEYCW